MDGLTISTSESLLNTGKTVSEINDLKLRKELQSGTDVSDSKSFADTLKDAVQSVNALQKDADIKMQQLATGEAKNIPEVMVAAEKADIAFKLMVQVRNKIIEAYQEVMKMQV
ncbi:MAG: flagellar hook-basal body complex protein FliE [Pseudobdellovibrionaceae bacterium]|nr:flagellar hook-basal body complex protein FliE [Bdellovibrionales bacterium]USN47283.1 MAG: flagellar hook-basal body complex protein FliE [Pseudobdellovibrionaceae bacterium]